MKKYPEKLQEIIDELSFFENQNERIELLIEYGEKFESVPKEIGTKPYPVENRVEYCESEAYVWVSEKDGKYNLYFAVENPQGISAKALCRILQESLSGADEKTILSITNDVVFDIFGKQLSMGKNLGLTGIIQMIKMKVQSIETSKK